ncbi:hypothetical protein P7M17_17910 [Vibrio parahaemolyticus]|nr:hypothetical protein [Vibrio parahaemolyticus]
MTPILYPNKETPRAYRVQDKTLGVQRYFFFNKHGSADEAKHKADLEIKKLQERRRMRAIRLNLDINKVFHEDGRVKGLRTGTRKIEGKEIPLLIAQITVNGKQIKTDRRLYNRCFNEVYRSIQDWILDKHGIERTPEITRMFKSCAWMYRI